MQLYERILAQKTACNALLEKKNEIIALLEEEVRDSDQQVRVCGLLAEWFG